MSTKELNKNVSHCQIEYIKDCISEYSKSTEKIFRFSYDNVAPKSIPLLRKSCWLKPVFIMDPGKQFNIKLVCADCKKPVADDGWNPNYRVIDCLSTDAYLVQKKYKCYCFKSSFTAYDLIVSDRIPDHLKLFYPFKGNSHHLLHEDIITLIMNDCVTGKSFEEIGKTIANYRTQHYLRQRSQYYALFASFKNNNTLHSIELEDFGAMDDANKYKLVI